ncbi:MAG TPA: twin-arginine translocase subunit TatC [Burkholderiales bacterium]|nr:twin-arginine translocase subunit TatC [Burkholderiales bacterium]
MSTQDTFISHLVELRDRILRSLLAIAFVFLVLFFAWPGASVIYDMLALPLMRALPEGTKMIATGVVAPFLVPVKVTALVALIVALPYVLWQAWAFIAPGLYQHEKRIALPLVFVSTVLFLTGIAFCYFFVFGRVFAFINEFAPKSITPAPDIENYLNFVLTMFVAFGITFEIPIIVTVMVRTGIIGIAKLKEVRPYVIVGNFVVAAILTPPDVVSQFMLAIPMCLLYELGILFAGVVGKTGKTSADPAPNTDPNKL